MAEESGGGEGVNPRVVEGARVKIKNNSRRGTGGKRTLHRTNVDEPDLPCAPAIRRGQLGIKLFDRRERGQGDRATWDSNPDDFAMVGNSPCEGCKRPEGEPHDAIAWVDGKANRHVGAVGHGTPDRIPRLLHHNDRLLPCY